MPKLFLLLIVVLTLGLPGCTSKPDEQQDKLPEAIVDRINLVDLDGNSIDLKDLKGKTVFLNFWATWCKPCIAEMPDIDAAAKMLKDEDFVFLAASDESMEKIEKYVAGVDYSFRFVRSKTSVFDMEIMALPTTMIINNKGEIVYNEVGARKWDSEAEINNLRELAAK